MGVVWSESKTPDLCPLLFCMTSVSVPSSQGNFAILALPGELWVQFLGECFTIWPISAGSEIGHGPEQSLNKVGMWALGSSYTHLSLPSQHRVGKVLPQCVWPRTRAVIALVCSKRSPDSHLCQSLHLLISPAHSMKHPFCGGIP